MSILSFSGPLTAEDIELMQQFGDTTATFHNNEIVELMAQGLSEECASDVSYLRTRSRHTPELEERLIASHKAGKVVMIMDWPDHEDGNYDPYTGVSLT